MNIVINSWIDIFVCFFGLFGCCLAETINYIQMQHPFLADHLSEIHQADTLYDSHFSTHSHLQQESLFQEQRSYARSVLAGWGLGMGELAYSLDNEATLRSLVTLVGYRQKDLLFRSKAKEEQAALQFERDKFRSFAEQAQRTADEYLKRVGMLENELAGLKAKGRKGDAQMRKEREEDRKTIAALRAKNEQALHEIKKKESEATRIREQMKRNVGEKSTPGKTTFEVYIPPRITPTKEEENDKYAFLMQRNERELAQAAKENSLLREKIFEMRDSLVRFNAWVDREIFGEQVEDSQQPRGYARKFYLNHNLLFKKESLTEELDALLETTKDGLLQLRDMFRAGKSPQSTPEKEEVLDFRKKPSRKEIKTDRVIASQPENKTTKTSINKRAEGSSEHHSPRAIRQQCISEATLKPAVRNVNKTTGAERKVGSLVSRPLPAASHSSKQTPFQDDLLSQVQDSSIISHISLEQLGGSRFDKWDILYQQE